MKEKFLLWFCWKLPRSVVYWCAIRLMAHATTGQFSNQEVPALLAVDALKRWGSGDGVFWNPYNKVVQDHRDGTIHHERTNQERALRGLPTPWKPELGDVECRQAPSF